MKKIIFALLCCMSMMAQAQNFKLTVNAQGEESIKRLYIYTTQGGDYNKYDATLDTLAMSNGKAAFSANLNRVEYAYICNAPIREASIRIQVFLVSDEECVITCKGSSYYYSGSEFYEQMNKADRALEPKSKALNAFVENAQKRIAEAGDKAEDIEQSIMAEYAQKLAEMNDACMDYLKAHSNEAGTAAFMMQNMEFDQLKEGVSDNVKQGVLKPYFSFMEETLRKQKEREAALAEAQKNIQPGMLAKDFTLNDNNGNPLTLSSLRGKYLVLDFWGSWCGWCIKGLPKMKEYYMKYDGKLEILGIDCNDTETAWKNAIAKYQIPWKHVYNPRTSTLTTDYAIEGYPTKIVLDPEGKIAKVIVGEDPAFYTYLDELLGK